jgi:hypothetical protein
MLTQYEREQQRRDRARDDVQGIRSASVPSYAHENAARRNVRQKAQRNVAQAAKLDAYVAGRAREAGRSALADIQEQSDERRTEVAS